MVIARSCSRDLLHMFSLSCCCKNNLCIAKYYNYLLRLRVIIIIDIVFIVTVVAFKITICVYKHTQSYTHLWLLAIFMTQSRKCAYYFSPFSTSVQLFEWHVKISIVFDLNVSGVNFVLNS